MTFDVDRQNFENMVHYNSTKLRLIQRGWDPYQVLTLPERQRLIKERILINGSRNDDILLSEEAMALLNTIYKNPL
jgi:hypothetical protein